MGAEQFSVRAKGKTVQEAFDNAVADAQWESGHGGYSGTIAEKAGRGYTVLQTPRNMKPAEFVRKVQQYNPRDKTLNPEAADLAKAYLATDDKWGPAGAVEDGDGWIFFGWASS